MKEIINFPVSSQENKRDNSEIIKRAAEIEKAEPALSSDDEMVLEFGLHSLRDLLVKRRKEELPSVIIFPETSARPLYYAVSPIINKIYQDNDLLAPNYCFVNAVRSTDKIKDYKSMDSESEGLKTLKQEINSLEKAQQGGWDSRSGIPYEVYDKLDDDIVNKREEYRLQSDWGVVLNERFKEILDANKTGNILVVDDFIGRGETLAQFKQMETILGADRKLDFFVFFDARKNSSDGRINSGLNKYEFRYKELASYNGLKFGGRPITGAMGLPVEPSVTINDKKSMVGVTKPEYPSKYVIRSSCADSKKMKQLRMEMNVIAKKVLEDANYDRKKKIDQLDIDFDI